MTIETKYNIGDEVWGVSHEEIWSGRITAITTYHAFGMSRIDYKVFVEEEMHFTFSEQDLFPTKEELIKSLYGMSKGFDLPSNKHLGNSHDFWLAPQKNTKKIVLPEKK